MRTKVSLEKAEDSIGHDTKTLGFILSVLGGHLRTLRSEMI